MTKPIRLNFFRSSSGKLNFGDELSPEIVKYVTRRKVEKATKNKYDLIIEPCTGNGSFLFKLAPRQILNLMYPERLILHYT